MRTKCIIRYSKNYWLIYSLVFAAFISLSLHWVWIGQSSFHSQGDDFRQHYNALLYIGRWYRQIIRNILINGNLEIPLYEWNLGYGADIITTFSYYGIADPFYMLSALVPARYTEYLFWILIVLRSYFMGIFFSKYCFYKGNGKFAALLGSILYVYCGFNLGPAFHQIIFQSGLIWLPLIFLGIEKIFKENRAGLYIISSAILICSSIYFYYMTVFAVIIYCLTYVSVHHYGIKKIGKYVLLFLIISIVPLLLTSFFTLPVVLSLLSNNRAAFSYSIPILYEIMYYVRVPALMFSLGDINSLYMGFSPIAVLALLLLFIRRQDTYLRVLSIICAVFIFVPWFGHFFNGNSFVCNRWSFALAFLMAYITVRMVPGYWNLTEKEYRKLFLTWTIYFVYCLLFKENRSIVVMAGFALGYLCMVTISFTLQYNHFIKKLLIILWVYLGVFNIIAGGISCSSRMKLGTAFDEITTNNPVRLFRYLNDTKEWKADQSSDALKRYNQSLYLGVSSTEYYWSMSTPSVLQFFQDVESSNNVGAMALGLDNRQYLENFLGVRYYLTRNGGVPYGFQSLVCEGEIDNVNYSIYKNTYRGDMIRYFSSKIAKDEYILLPVEKRQEVLLQAAVSSQSDAEDNIQYKSKAIPFTFQNAEGVSIENNKFIVENADATVELLLNDRIKHGELYVILERIRFSGVNPYRQLSEDTSWRDKKRAERWNSFLQYLQWKESDAIQIKIMFENITKSINHLTPKNKYGYGRDNYLCNLGYVSDAESNTIKLAFPTAGVYSYSDLRVVMQPLNDLTIYDRNMYDTICQLNHRFTNGMKSTVKLKEEGYIQFAIPYSGGWSVLVDGKKRLLEQSSTLFMGMDMEEGEHIIELYYRTPGIKEGILITGITIIFICLLWMRNVFKKKETYHINISRE